MHLTTKRLLLQLLWPSEDLIALVLFYCDKAICLLAPIAKHISEIRDFILLKSGVAHYQIYLALLAVSRWQQITHLVWLQRHHYFFNFIIG